MATEPDKVDNSVLGTLILVLTFGVLGTALAVTALVRTEADQLRGERSQANDAFAALRGSQEADLHLPPAYIDQSAGKVRVPVERAMQVVVRDLRRNPQSATWTKPEPPAAKNGDGEGAAPGDVMPVPDAADESGKKPGKGEPKPKPKKPQVPVRPEAPLKLQRRRCPRRVAPNP